MNRSVIITGFIALAYVDRVRSTVRDRIAHAGWWAPVDGEPIFGTRDVENWDFSTGKIKAAVEWEVVGRTNAEETR